MLPFVLRDCGSRYPPFFSTYYVDGEFVDTSGALRSGGIHENRVFIEYATGYGIYVNGNEKAWTIDIKGKKIVLPQWGF